MATEAVLQSVELLEMMLYELPMRDLLLAQRVCTRWQAVILGSKHLQRALFLEPTANGPVHARLAKRTNLDEPDYAYIDRFGVEHTAKEFESNGFVVNPLLRCLYPGWDRRRRVQKTLRAAALRQRGDDDRMGDMNAEVNSEFNSEVHQEVDEDEGHLEESGAQEPNTESEDTVAAIDKGEGDVAKEREISNDTSSEFSLGSESEDSQGSQTDDEDSYGNNLIDYPPAHVCFLVEFLHGYWESWSRPEASWRRMFLTQPPCVHMMQIDMRQESSGSVSDQDGVRMGKLCDNNPSSPGEIGIKWWICYENGTA
ncbi:hypothetical protein K490DRAFT_61373 [Saccharata proteae CBS 121410]|uniref:F-box domain-containing protein n=1 Tax=Saccharata proteae CBS 121410 TaxID=1314787 RepID=A0A9P4I2D6_9PEZI|nr:hypothetical protein K490DRAFT_61373 [Saccharata proteae CBS 121410]